MSRMQRDPTPSTTPAKSGIQGPGFLARRVSGVIPKTAGSQPPSSISGSVRSMSVTVKSSTLASRTTPAKSPAARSRVVSMDQSGLTIRSPFHPSLSNITSPSHTNSHIPSSSPSPSTTVIPRKSTPERTIVPRASSLSVASPMSTSLKAPKGQHKSSPPSKASSISHEVPSLRNDSSSNLNLDQGQRHQSTVSPHSTPRRLAAAANMAATPQPQAMPPTQPTPSITSSGVVSPTVSWANSSLQRSQPNPFVVTLPNGKPPWERTLSSLENGVEEGEYGDDNMTMDMITEDGNVDEEIHTALKAVEDLYTQRITLYRRLLERAQASSSQQLLALEAALDAERNRASEYRVKVQVLKQSLDDVRARPVFDFGQSGFDIVSAMRGDGFGGFDEEGIRNVLRSMRQADRMRLTHIILDTALPGDVPLMISLLNRYAMTSFDIMIHLPTDLAANVLCYLSIPELLVCEHVSHKWLDMCRNDALYQILVKGITRHDPVPIKEPREVGGWRKLYMALHNREQNWAWGNPQSLSFLKGHSGFCTTLLLKGNRLISGSYDETIRVWDIDSGEQLKMLKVKAVSCIDYLDEQEVFAVGFHDVGRVQIFSSLTWSPLQTLQGHLYGIRAVALSSTYLVSAGADKAIVVWEWRTGKKIVRFGQQINMCIGVQIMEEDRIVSVTIDGVVRTFSISRREMIGQFQLNQLSTDDPVAATRLSMVGVGPNNMLQWFAAKGRQMTCATKTIILHLTWPEGSGSLDLSCTEEASNVLSPVSASTLSPTALRHPTLVTQSIKDSKKHALSISTSSSGLSSTPTKVGTSSSVSPLLRKSTGHGGRPSWPSPRSTTNELISSPSSVTMTTRAGDIPRLEAVLETPDVACGAVDPRKRRVVTSTRFSSRLGADRRMFVSTYDESRTEKLRANNINASPDGKTTPTSERSNDVPSAPTHLTAESNSSPGIAEIRGAWGALADESWAEAGVDAKALPGSFKGLATPELNPMALALNHEKIVVGCADGTIYVMSFVGHKYSLAEARSRARVAMIQDMAAEHSD